MDLIKVTGSAVCLATIAMYFYGLLQTDKMNTLYLIIALTSGVVVLYRFATALLGYTGKTAMPNSMLYLMLVTGVIVSALSGYIVYMVPQSDVQLMYLYGLTSTFGLLLGISMIIFSCQLLSNKQITHTINV